MPYFVVIDHACSATANIQVIYTANISAPDKSLGKALGELWVVVVAGTATPIPSDKLGQSDLGNHRGIWVDLTTVAVMYVYLDAHVRARKP
jgi:hypothetical protein